MSRRRDSSSRAVISSGEPVAGMTLGDSRRRGRFDEAHGRDGHLRRGRALAVRAVAALREQKRPRPERSEERRAAPRARPAPSADRGRRGRAAPARATRAAGRRRSRRRRSRLVGDAEPRPRVDEHRHRSHDRASARLRSPSAGFPIVSKNGRERRLASDSSASLRRSRRRSRSGAEQPNSSAMIAPSLCPQRIGRSRPSASITASVSSAAR